MQKTRRRISRPGVALAPRSGARSARPDIIRAEERAEGRAERSPHLISSMLNLLDPSSRVEFRFRQKGDYIVLYPSGQINVRGEDDLFKPWGMSEFRHCLPKSIFSTMGGDVELVRLHSPLKGFDKTFSSLDDFLSWVVSVGGNGAG
jgi:hypothetical protein